MSIIERGFVGYMNNKYKSKRAENANKETSDIRIKKENRSVIKTKNQLKLGLITLLKDKPAPEITVKELCELADVNRGTFYYHYSDIFDMINKVQEGFFEDFYEIINDIINYNGKIINPDFFIEQVFEFFAENAELSEIFLGANGDKSFLDSLKELVDKKCSVMWSEAGSHMKDAEFDLFNSFIINGFIGLLETWLKAGRKQSPKYMANFVAKIIIPSAVHTLALDENTYR